jgi:hypothetical protein
MMLIPQHRLRHARALAERYRHRQAAVPAPRPATEPDVLLDIPDLHVDKVELKVEELTAHVALDARVLDLVQLHVGVDAQLRGVDLDIEGVGAQALLKVRLDNLVSIVDRTMTVLERKPRLRALQRRAGR